MCFPLFLPPSGKEAFGLYLKCVPRSNHAGDGLHCQDYLPHDILITNVINSQINLLVILYWPKLYSLNPRVPFLYRSFISFIQFWIIICHTVTAIQFVCFYILLWFYFPFSTLFLTSFLHVTWIASLFKKHCLSVRVLILILKIYTIFFFKWME